jgi:phenylacetate-CoA ligase
VTVAQGRAADPFATYGPVAFANAWRSPFCRRKLEAAGIAPGTVPDAERFRRIQPTTKDELRALSGEEFARDVVVCRPDEVATVWRSGGVTGRPLFYPRARADYGVLLGTFARVYEMAGVGAGDLVHNAFPLGTHPIGHMFTHAAHEVGAGCVPAGSGANTPTDTQVQLLFELRPTVLIGLASYLVHLGHAAESLGRSPRDAGVRVLINSGEGLSPAKRRRVEATWGARLVSAYGMSECSMMGCECAVQDGFHLWDDLFHLEILDPAGWEPVVDGQEGVVVVTPLHNSHATPFLRWVSGDVGSVVPSCACDGPFSSRPRLRLTGRTSGFSKVKGVNVDHQVLEDALLRLEPLADYMAWAEEVEGRDRLRIEVEAAGGVAPDELAGRVADLVRSAFEIRPVVTPVDRGTVARRLEGQVKQVRFRDTRG